MHRLLEYICNELEDLEQKVKKNDKLSMQEIQYLDTLAHAKKNLMKAEEMAEQEYSMRGGSYRGSYARAGEGSYEGSYGGSYRFDSPEYLMGGSGSYARGRGRGARRDSMGRYASEGGYSRAETKSKLRQIIEAAPDERTRRQLEELMQEMQDE